MCRPDGYLWFGTLAGLVRFDGIEFKVFDQSNTKELSADAITAVYVDSESTLWAAHAVQADRTTICSVTGNGKFRSYAKEDGFSGASDGNFLNLNFTGQNKVLEANYN